MHNLIGLQPLSTPHLRYRAQEMEHCSMSQLEQGLEILCTLYYKCKYAANILILLYIKDSMNNNDASTRLYCLGWIKIFKCSFVFNPVSTSGLKVGVRYIRNKTRRRVIVATLVRIIILHRRAHYFSYTTSINRQLRSFFIR